MSKSLLFIDDTKIYNIATNPEDRAALHNDLDLATSWSEKWDIYVFQSYQEYSPQY